MSLGAVLISSSAMAGTFADQCPDIASCAKAVGELLGQKYIFDGDTKGQIKATPNLELTKENAELLFTNALNMNGYSRVPLGMPHAYQIMRQRDARDSAIPTVTADAHTPPALPDNWDLYTMKYKATNPEVVDDIARMSRSFMPANSRIIPFEASGQLLVTDTALNLKKLYGIVIDNDVKLTPEMKKRRMEELKEADRKRSQKMNAESAQKSTQSKR